MTEPTCRTCYTETLTPEQRELFFSEQVTMPVFYCPRHQHMVDKMMADHLPMVASFEIKGVTTGRFPRSRTPIAAWEDHEAGDPGRP